jgi:hypothetical protein
MAIHDPYGISPEIKYFQRTPGRGVTDRIQIQRFRLEVLTVKSEWKGSKGERSSAPASHKLNSSIPPPNRLNAIRCEAAMMQSRYRPSGPAWRQCLLFCME